MTRDIHGRIPENENEGIGNHLQNHVHLTNCIHLRNHMHRQSPILAGRSLARDLVVLQRSRSLRDPSTSPPSWRSYLPRKLEKESTVQNGRRRSDGGLGCRGEARKLPTASITTAKVSAEDFIFGNGERLLSNSTTDGVRDEGGERELSGRSRQSDQLEYAEKTSGDGQSFSQRMSRKAKQSQNIHLKSLKEQLYEFSMDADEGYSPNAHCHRRCKQKESTNEEPEASNPSYHNQSCRGKKGRSPGLRRSRDSVVSRGFGGQSEVFGVSDLLAHRYSMEGREERGDHTKLGVTEGPQNGCGIPWNWSRIHHRGKSFIDLAGRGLSCGLTESRLRKGGTLPYRKDAVDMAVGSESSSSSGKFHAEAVPLLLERSGSQGITDNAAWMHDYSGELGIFADHNLKHDVDSDLASEALSDHQRSSGCRHGSHQSLTQKYAPRTFKDLMGQNLVAQALLNAVLKKKVGFLYVFYGPPGAGKTSCARIFARALNCQSSEHQKPCGSCNSCISHDLGKSRNVREVGPVGNFDFGSGMDMFDSTMISELHSQYRVFICDDCDTLPLDSWSGILKVIDRAPRHVVIILISANLDHLPHRVISRCQKFFFPKLKDADVIYTLQSIATKEGLEIDKDALKLIASRSDGSLRDAQMMLEQLSLIGQRITVPLVQELVGLISDEKLVDLLDLALSADTVNTVKNLREIVEAGMDPLTLMSQLAAIITDILAGSNVFTKGKLQRKFFRRLTLSKEDMEKLRQALKTLSQAEKQLRTSNDKLTWLTAALLQLAPDKLYTLPSSSAETSLKRSTLLLDNPKGRNIAERGIAEPSEMSNSGFGLSTSITRDPRAGYSVYHDSKMYDSTTGGKKYASFTPNRKSDVTWATAGHVYGKDCKDIEIIWLAVLEKIEIDALKQFMHEEGKLVSVSFGAALTVRLSFSSHIIKSKVEKFREHILEAFECVLGSPVTIEIIYGSRKDVKGKSVVPLVLPSSEDGTSETITFQESLSNNISKAGYDRNHKGVSKDTGLREVGYKNEIVEIAGSPREPAGPGHLDSIKQITGKSLVDVDVRETHLLERREIRQQPQSQGLVRSKVSLAHLLKQAEESQRDEQSRSHAISIAEKLEQENLRLEPKSRSLLCWKASRVTRGKLSQLKIRTRRSRALFKLVSSGRCLSAKSPR